MMAGTAGEGQLLSDDLQIGGSKRRLGAVLV